MTPAAGNSVTVVPVEGARLWRAFHRLPHKVYADDPNWIAPILLERQIHFKHTAYFQHAKASFWLAFKDGEPVGRMTAQIDELHLKQHNDATGHFGYLEAIDDPAVFAALLTAGESWLKTNGMTRALGPVSFAMWDEPGLLVDGFDTPPNIMMGHHRPYYQQRIREQGYTAAQDVLAYIWPVQNTFGPILDKMVETGRKKHAYVMRPIRMDKASFSGEIALIRDIINDAWADNWGFVPITYAEIEEIGNLFKFFLKPESLVIAEYDGEPSGVAMMLPNFAEHTRDLNGKLFPFGLLKLIWRLKRRHTKSGRLALMGVRRKYRTTPAGAVMALLMIKTCQQTELVRRAENLEMSWILDSNEPIKRMLEAFGCYINKRYRIFEKTL